MAEAATQTASSDGAAPGSIEPKKQHDSSFYKKDLPQLPQNFAELLEKYSGMPPSEQISHVVTLRDEAYKAYHYPCLGLFRFTVLSLAYHPLYKSYVLPTLLTPPTENEANDSPIFLDLGTCLGQDIRKLVFDGVPSSRVYGADLLPAFIDLGYQLFRDTAKIPPDHFLAPADVFDATPTNALSALDGKVTILQTNSLFHLFNYTDQFMLAKRAVRLLRPGPERLILGSHVGNVVAAEYPGRIEHRASTKFRHNEQSWKEFWERVSVELGGKVTFKVESRVFEPKMLEGVKVADTWRGEGYHWMVWNVWVKFV